MPIIGRLLALSPAEAKALADAPEARPTLAIGLRFEGCSRKPVAVHS